MGGTVPEPPGFPLTLSEIGASVCFIGGAVESIRALPLVLAPTYLQLTTPWLSEYEHPQS